MREALYRKHRPKKLSDVVGQAHITDTLSNAFNSGKISHGYLFAGPRGVGKTSVARIFAHQINKFDYGSKNNALDIIEIDAASNRRIDEIRELRSKVHLAPALGKYKVYIIDEVHMLTKEAFNALLKTLEEPPEHIVFILATTEAHKVPDTIISRTQHFTFKSVNPSLVAEHLNTIAKLEGIDIDQDSLKLIANYGRGSFRDSISLLDQLSSTKKITQDTVFNLLGLPSSELLENILGAVIKKDLPSLVNLLEQARSKGINPQKLSTGLVDQILSDSANNSDFSSLLKLAKEILQTNNSPDPDKYLELTLADFIISNTEENQPIIKTTTVSTIQSKEDPSKIIKLKKPSSPIKDKANTQAPDTPPTSLDAELWQAILDNLKKKRNTLYGIVRMGQPSINKQSLLLTVRFPFHKKQLSEEKNSRIIREIATAVLGYPVQLIIEIAPEQGVNQAKLSQSVSDQAISVVTSIFGGGEVLEP